MYYKEKWIDGKLFYKHTPNGKWFEFSKSMYASRLYELELALKTVKT